MQVGIGDELHIADLAGCHSQYVYPVLYQQRQNFNFVQMFTEVDRMFIDYDEDLRRFESRRQYEPLEKYVLHQHDPDRYWFQMFDNRGKIWE